MNTNSPLSTITYGTHSIDPNTLPQSSIEALLRRGISHVLGNEVASKVTAEVERQGKESKDAEGNVIPGHVTTDDEKAGLKAKFQLAMIEALTAGTLGTRVAGTGVKLDPVDAEIRRIALDEVATVLKANGLKLPTKDNVVEFASGEKLTREDLIERRIAKHGDRLRKAAESTIRAKAREAEKAKAIDAAELL